MTYGVSEYESGHIVSAENIPLEQILSNLDRIKSYHQIVVYCRSGNRSAHVKKILNDQGISNVLDAGSLASMQTLANASGFLKEELVKEVEAIPHNPALKDDSILKILIPTDFSVQADYSYLMVRKLEENLSVDIHFLHVLDVPDTVTLDSGGNIETCGEIDKEFLQTQKEIIERKLNNLKTAYGDHISVHLLFGKVTDAIIQFAESNQFELIIMGTKGSWGLKEKISASQAQIIARKSHIPLLSLMCDRSDLVIKDILYVHDFKEAGTMHILLMNKFAKYFDANYHQLYVAKENEAIDEVNILNIMDAYAKENGFSKHFNHIVYSSDVDQGVQKLLSEQDADIVFVGTHGLGGLFHHSGAESLVKHLFKPLISFHLT
ncbi:MAG: universal stress protein [Saprospiraceae bacterium]|nr:universal stress protein [Saprospiraceae bacterium]